MSWVALFEQRRLHSFTFRPNSCYSERISCKSPTVSKLSWKFESTYRKLESVRQKAGVGVPVYLFPIYRDFNWESEIHEGVRPLENSEFWRMIRHWFDTSALVLGHSSSLCCSAIHFPRGGDKTGAILSTFASEAMFISNFIYGKFRCFLS